LLQMHYFKGKSTRTIGRELNRSHSAIVKRLKKVRRKLYNIINKSNHKIYL